MSYVDTPWTELASRTARGLLARKGASYQRVCDLIRASGIEESVRGVEGKISRGTYKVSFFLRLLIVLGAEYPEHWRPILASTGSDEVHAKHILLRELSARNLDVDMFAKKLATVGVAVPRELLMEQLATGTFQFVLLLQLASADRIPGFERFVDDCDLAEVSLRAQDQQIK
ncbi:DUF6471 domain-containing protein [Ralstonia solanacearum]|uniref:DUF6471 domain-containing protein n=1 Tax=Ralstonia solanacearum TaxID=305 RepID=UPI00202A06E8|nr:DUF6471 domain-containing protein [Ralstonia solanacearum]MCL9846989.1 DUF6471 domain-containing protein [Ralstonia solanacearum]MDC6254951.1 DUF6471 domain-containing protein [Ralstonia solanacearum]MDC6261217.1 DUF6471 domain-containing protein [Ralstonia solanacearum]MDC6304289.1 DUF6471 domain-containing protein [Ralstonia solanacearum]